MLPWGLAIVWAAAAGPAAAPPAAPAAAPPAGSRSFPRLFRGLAPVPAASPCGFPAGCSHPLPLSLLHFCNTQSHVYSPFNHRDFWIFCSLFFSSSFLFFFFNIINYNLIWKFPIDGFDFFFLPLQIPAVSFHHSMSRGNVSNSWQKWPYSNSIGPFKCPMRRNNDGEALETVSLEAAARSIRTPSIGGGANRVPHAARFTPLN